MLSSVCSESAASISRIFGSLAHFSTLLCSSVVGSGSSLLCVFPFGQQELVCVCVWGEYRGRIWWYDTRVKGNPKLKLCVPDDTIVLFAAVPIHRLQFWAIFCASTNIYFKCMSVRLHHHRSIDRIVCNSGHWLHILRLRFHIFATTHTHTHTKKEKNFDTPLSWSPENHKSLIATNNALLDSEHRAPSTHGRTTLHARGTVSQRFNWYFNRFVKSFEIIIFVVLRRLPNFSHLHLRSVFRFRPRTRPHQIHVVFVIIAGNG